MVHGNRETTSRIRSTLSRAAVVVTAVVALSGCEGLFDGLLEELFLETLEPAELEVEIVNLPGDFDRADVWVIEAETDEILADGVDPADEDAIEEAAEEWLEDQEVPEEIPEDFVAGYGVASDDADYVDDTTVTRKVSPDASVENAEIVNAAPDQIDGNVYVVNAAVRRGAELDFGVWFAIVGANEEPVSSVTLDFEEHFETD